MMERIALIGCSKLKRDIAAGLPKVLYKGSLTSCAMEFCQLRGIPWFVMSAKYGLLAQNELVLHYDTTFADLSTHDRLAWPLDVARELLERIDENANPNQTTIEIHAGNTYANPLSLHLETMGFRVERFGQGLDIGQRVSKYLAEIHALTTAGVNA